MQDAAAAISAMVSARTPESIKEEVDRLLKAGKYEESKAFAVLFRASDADDLINDISRLSDDTGEQHDSDDQHDQEYHNDPDDQNAAAGRSSTDESADEEAAAVSADGDPFSVIPSESEKRASEKEIKEYMN